MAAGDADVAAARAVGVAAGDAVAESPVRTGDGRLVLVDRAVAVVIDAVARLVHRDAGRRIVLSGDVGPQVGRRLQRQVDGQVHQGVVGQVGRRGILTWTGCVPNGGSNWVRPQPADAPAATKNTATCR